MSYREKRFILTPKESGHLDGPHSRRSEFLFIISMMKEFVKGFRALHFVGPCITVFGSARFKEDHIYYKQAMEIGKRLSQAEFTVMTGGGPGIMEAANRGAFENGGWSVGCNIQLPEEQMPNKYMHKWVTIKYFYVRKVLLIKYSYGFIVMPGGVGTMDELFETLTLIQTKTIRNFPVVLIGKEYYKDITDLLEQMLAQKTISDDDMKLILITNDLNEAIEHIQFYVKSNYNVEKIKPKWWLGEVSFFKKKLSRT